MRITSICLLVLVLSGCTDRRAYQCPFTWRTEVETWDGKSTEYKQGYYAAMESWSAEPDKSRYEYGSDYWFGWRDAKFDLRIEDAAKELSTKRYATQRAEQFR